MIIKKEKFTEKQYLYLRDTLNEGVAIDDKRILHKLEKLGVLKCLHDTFTHFHVEYVEPFQVEYIGLFCAKYEKNATYPKVIKDFRFIENEWLHFLRMDSEPKYFERGVIKDGKIYILDVTNVECVFMEYLPTSALNVLFKGFNVEWSGYAANRTTRHFYYALIEHKRLPFRLAFPSIENRRLCGREWRSMEEILKELRIKMV